jgi:hypothetical protein
LRGDVDALESTPTSAASLRSGWLDAAGMVREDW